MSVNSYLGNLGSKLVLSVTENDSIKRSINSINAHLMRTNDMDIVKNKVYGSFVRGTILPRKIDENSDVDIMVIFRNIDGYKPQTFLNKLKEFTENHYPRSYVHQSRPSVVVELNHIKFELTPTFMSNGTYNIPRNQSEWMFTDPVGFYDDLNQCNKNNRFMIKPIVRLLKHWNIHKNQCDYTSYDLEKKISTDLMYAYSHCTTYTDYLRYAFLQIRYYTSTERVNRAIVNIDDALRLEKERCPLSALNRIKAVFPEV